MIWLKELSLSDDLQYFNLLIELAGYEDAYAKPVPEDFSFDEYEDFKKARIKMVSGENLPSYVKKTSTYWVMDDEEAIGYATLKHEIDFDKPGGHFGCCLKKSHQNKGIGTQVASLLSDIAYEKLGINEVVYTAKLENIQSQRSLEKIGAKFIKEENGYKFYIVDITKKRGR